ncbi:MAG: NADH dehydrogenase subunit D, partial [Acidimicrobiales bacterium]
MPTVPAVGVTRPVDMATPGGMVGETDEAGQELLPRSATGADEIGRERGAVLRVPEDTPAGDPGDIDIESLDDETMIINFGPQHPSTHGVLRLMLELDGETVLRTKPVIGYLHTGMEKTGEELTFQQGSTNVTRMDYLSPLTNELVFSMATEALLGIELPPRATWIRMLLAEMQRVASHLMWLATNGMDLGSTTMMIFGFREREMVLGFF